MRELLFNQNTEQETFQVLPDHRLRKFSQEDLESQVRGQIPNTFSLLPFPFCLFPFSLSPVPPPPSRPNQIRCPGPCPVVLQDFVKRKNADGLLGHLTNADHGHSMGQTMNQQESIQTLACGPHDVCLDASILIPCCPQKRHNLHGKCRAASHQSLRAHPGHVIDQPTGPMRASRESWDD